MCTPFDEDSVKRVINEKYDILKIASCSIDDWPLLNSLKGCNIPIIASLGGGNLNDISKLNSFFRHYNIVLDFILQMKIKQISLF